MGSTKKKQFAGKRFYYDKKKKTDKKVKEKPRKDVVGDAVKSLNLTKDELQIGKVRDEVSRLRIQEQQAKPKKKKWSIKLSSSSVKKAIKIVAKGMKNTPAKKSFEGDDDVVKKNRRNQKKTNNM